MKIGEQIPTSQMHSHLWVGSLGSIVLHYLNFTDMGPDFTNMSLNLGCMKLSVKLSYNKKQSNPIRDAQK